MASQSRDLVDMPWHILNDIIERLDYVSLRFFQATCRCLRALPNKRQIMWAFDKLECDDPYSWECDPMCKAWDEDSKLYVCECVDATAPLLSYQFLANYLPCYQCNTLQPKSMFWESDKTYTSKVTSSCALTRVCVAWQATDMIWGECTSYEDRENFCIPVGDGAIGYFVKCAICWTCIWSKEEILVENSTIRKDCMGCKRTRAMRKYWHEHQQELSES